MRYHATAAALVLLSLGSAAAADQTSEHAPKQLVKPAHLGAAALLPRALTPHGMSRLRARQSGCSSGESTCGADGCIPSSAECCDASDGSFCPAGYYCDGPGCCEDGETCSGPAIGCPDGTELCGLSDCVLEGECTDGSGGSGGSGGGSGSDDETTTTTTSTTSDLFDSRPTSTTTTDDFADAFPTPTTSSSTTDFDTSFPTDTTTTPRSLPTPTGQGSIRPPSAGSSLLAPILSAFVGAALAVAAVAAL